MSLGAENLVEWKKLILQLSYVLSAEVVADDSGNVTEIHVLACEGRSPKQIMRDIQSAIMAKFCTEVDHKIISIAQIPGSGRTVNGAARLRYSGLDLSFSDKCCTVKVTLSYENGFFCGSESCDLALMRRYKAVAGATVKAVNDFLSTKASLTLEDVRLSESCGRPIVLVAVTFAGEGAAEVLTGTCFAADDTGAAAVKATLDAVNRKLSII